jgi:sugar-specific transcriptional regulator TrmB
VSTADNLDEAIEVLQQLGLKEYEARCFVGLTRLDRGTAKQLSEITEVPRTRVYDAIRILEAKGLVEIQHSSPQQFRAVPLEEATDTLRDQYEARVERLEDCLEPVDVVEPDDGSPGHQVWSMSGHESIEHRTADLLEAADEEIVLVVGSESLLTEEFVATLRAVDDDVELLVGALSPALRDRIQTEVPGATTFVSGLEWLQGDDSGEDETAIGRLLLVDRSTILVSTIVPKTGKERAVFGEGFDNGLVVIARRLMARGLLTTQDPGL